MDQDRDPCRYMGPIAPPAPDGEHEQDRIPNRVDDPVIYPEPVPIVRAA